MITSLPTSSSAFLPVMPTVKSSERVFPADDRQDHFQRTVKEPKFGIAVDFHKTEDLTRALQQLQREMSAPSFSRSSLNDFSTLRRLNALRIHYGAPSEIVLSRYPETVKALRAAFHQDVWRREEDLYNRVMKASGKSRMRFADWERHLQFSEYFTPTASGPFTAVRELLKLPPGARPKVVSVGTGFTPSTGIFLAENGWNVTGFEIDPDIHQASLKLLDRFVPSIRERFKIKNMNAADYRDYEDKNLVYITTMVPHKDRLKIFEQVLKAAEKNPNIYVITHNVFGLGQLGNEHTPEKEILSRFDIIEDHRPNPTYVTYILKPKGRSRR